MWRDPYLYPSAGFNPAPQSTGWVCPVCGRSNAPWVASCNHVAQWSQPYESWPNRGPNWGLPETITCSSFTIEPLSKPE
jgi:hypothetical protein